ncbi:imidazolonepropionase [Flindersiella endophytica]
MSGMTSIALTGIGLLVTNSPEYGHGPLGEIRDAALVVDHGDVVWVGPRTKAPVADLAVDAAGRCVVPGFVDSHTHPVFAGDRAREFAARMAGEQYAAKGIAQTVAATRAAPDDVLQANLARLANELRRHGTTTFEAKSGYGLTVADEKRALAIAHQFTDETTFLGAHVVPPEYAHAPDDYVALVSGEMLQAVRPYARWIDVFVEKGAFDEDQARGILASGKRAGLGLRVHANQLAHGQGIQLACEFGASSADHCTYATKQDIAALADAGVVGTFLPGAEFSTRSPYPDAREFLKAGVTIALATDCNPGTSYTSAMPFCIALAVREMHLTPAEALYAATKGGAKALRNDRIGALCPDSRADLAILDAPDYIHLAYRPGVQLVADTWKAGRPGSEAHSR